LCLNVWGGGGSGVMLALFRILTFLFMFYILIRGAGPRPGFFLYPDYRPRHFLTFLGFSWIAGPGHKSNLEPRNRPRLFKISVFNFNKFTKSYSSLSFLKILQNLGNALTFSYTQLIYVLANIECVWMLQLCWDKQRIYNKQKLVNFNFWISSEFF